MVENIKISIIVPVFNLEHEITDCVKSILCQTHKNIEIIIVDDGSKDQSKVIIQKLADEDDRIVPVFKANGGVTSARLAGVKIATGDWIGFVDGDDYIEPDMYERLLSNALKYDAQISHCGYQMCFPDGRVNYFHNTGRLATQDKLTGLCDLLAGSFIEPGLWNKLFHKTLFHSLLHDGVMDTSIKINEDLLMNYYLFKEADNSIFEDWCPYHYLVRYTSASRQKLNEHKIYDPIKVKEIIKNDSFPGLETDSQNAYLGTCINIYSSLIAAGANEYKKDLQNIRNLIAEKNEDFTTLPKKSKLQAIMICKTPLIYQAVYKIYAEKFQKKKYE